VGGFQSHRNARHVFYANAHGLILVHDLSNAKSQANLRNWLAEFMER
jgi:Rab-like protein 3